MGGMLTRKPSMLVRAALANKMARIAWALMARCGVYKSRSQLHKPTVGREDVKAKEGKKQFGATVVRCKRPVTLRGLDGSMVGDHRRG